ncbi:MAG: hypothetical protein SNJ71_00125 [Bacteroidales bacterium]
MKEIVNRLKSPTPEFFRKLRNFSLLLGTVSAAILTSPVSLPASIVTLAGYITVASGVCAAVSQLPVEDPSKL